MTTTSIRSFAHRLLALLGLTLLASSAHAATLDSLSHIHGIAAATDQPGAVYLATHNGFFKASPDGTAVQVSSTTDDFMALVQDPTDPTTFYASGHPRSGGNLGLLKSTDGGKNWERISTGLNGPVDYHAMTVSPADPARIYGMYRGLQVSRDGGKSWSMANLPTGTRSLAASTLDPDTLYAATQKGLKISRDAGQTWSPALLFQLPASVVHVTSDGHVYAFLLQKGLMKVKEPGRAWKPIQSNFGDAIPMHIASDRNDPARLYLLDNQGRLWTSPDGGDNWAPFAG